MTLFLSLLPIYLFGNFHCFGMCGPLVLMIGRHKFRALYFLGRLCSFTLAGWISGQLGFVLQIFLSAYHVGAFVSLIFGAWLIYLGCGSVLRMPKWDWLDRRLRRVNHTLSLLILKDQPLSTFLFGFFTLLLPCGQTLVVFSACALVGIAWIGAMNGLLFALITSPGLFFAMHLPHFFSKFHKISNYVIGMTAFSVGFLSLLRGLAEMGWIHHLILSEKYHMVIW